MEPRDIPIPPMDLASRVGPLADDAVDYYLRLGAEMRSSIEGLLGPSWSWEGKSVLDFGSGAGRLLRHFQPEARSGTSFTGADSDPEAIDWAARHFGDGFRFVHNELQPPLESPDGEFDLVIALSVFTHIADGWAEWLLELRRVIAPGGYLIATFLADGAKDLINSLGLDAYDDTKFGMNILGDSDRYETATVFHSPWWIEAHWGRAFEIEQLKPSGFIGPPGHGQGVAVMRPNGAVVDPSRLEQPEPGEHREVTALQHNVRQLYAPSPWAAERERRLQQRVETMETSLSWRITAPLRRLAASVRRLRG